MKTNRAYIYLIVVLLLVVGLACQRSIPGAAPKATNTPGAAEAQPTSPTDVMDQIYFFATQTAMAAQGGATAGPAGATPAPGDTQVPPVATAAQPSSPTQPTGPIQPVPTSAPAGGNAPVQAPALTVPATYTLQKNEFPFCIARRFNVDPGDLLRMNGLNTYSVYYAGMALRIPQTGRGFPGNRALQPHPASYKVGPNDTIFSIACVFGDVDPMAIAYVNGLQAPYRLSAGQTLQIP